MRPCQILLCGLCVLCGELFAQAPTTSSFTIFIQGRVVGSEQVTVSNDSSGHVLSGSARMGPPLDVAFKRVHIKYGANWAPVEAELEGTVRSQPVTIKTVFATGTATSQIAQATGEATKADKVADDTLVLPNGFFGSHEALATRLQQVKPGASLRAYVLPQAEIGIRVAGMADERIQLAGGTIQVKRYELVFDNPGGPVNASLYTDDSGRMIRLQIPAQSIDVLRSDVASVSARRELISHPGDEQIQIPAYGFTLAATVTRPFDSAPAKPAGAKPAPALRLPAIVLVGGSGPMDRDETVAGIPVMGQLAGALADAGYLTVRYDKRGIGQSGGRAESVTLQDFAEDVRAVVKYVRDRKDVNRDRVTLLGHSEGGWVGMLAAQKEKDKIAGLVLLGTPATTGAELVLEQQRHALDLLNTPAAERDEKIVMQRRIHRAVLTGKGWEDVPDAMRKRADIPWFHSLLAFDPATVLLGLRQPVLIVNGAIDRQVPPAHAERLAALARERKKVPQAPAVKVLPGLNHLFVKAGSGEVEEYAVLAERSVSPDVSAAIIEWLRTTFK